MRPAAAPCAGDRQELSRSSISQKDASSVAGDIDAAQQSASRPSRRRSRDIDDGLRSAPHESPITI